MREQATGLTLGKYAPFHKGHQFLIDTALREVDHLIVVIYHSPEVTAVPLSVRAEWIRRLYPQVEVIEAPDGPSDMGDTPEIKKKQETYILKLLKGRKISHFYSSEFYGEHMSKALSAMDRRVDVKRSFVPISATQIRSDPFRYRDYVDPLVYRDLITNVVFLGAPSTGKTTLAAHLAREFNTLWMPEYGREYWEKYQIDRRLTLDQLVEIAEEHLKREEVLLRDSNGFLFTDTNAMTTHLFALYYHGRSHSRLIELADLCAARYDFFFLCDVDIPYEDSWDRSGAGNRDEFHERIVRDLNERKIPYHLLRGSLEERATTVSEKVQFNRLK